jgi:hypothetical protein
MSTSSQNQRIRQDGVVRNLYKIVGDARKINSRSNDTLSILKRCVLRSNKLLVSVCK